MPTRWCGHALVPGLDERLNQMADHIIASIDEGQPDEALIIGHSFGTQPCIASGRRVLARRPDLGQPGSPLALVTLGATGAARLPQEAQLVS